MRGTRFGVWSDDVTGGIIPARAGNTWSTRPPRPTTRDHPRACGEHREMRARRAKAMGSSPRVRGTLGLRVVDRCRLGIIPARAGNTQRKRGRPVHSWDHPRACGEHYELGAWALEQTGSSPRVRGTQRAACRDRERAGIIPARAGNTRHR